LEKFLGYSEINSEIPDFAAAISNKFSIADPEIPFASGSYRPIRDAHKKSHLK
jgi:hypothetical protein